MPVDAGVERRHAGHTLQHAERVAGLQDPGQPLAREDAAGVVVGRDDGRLAGPVGQVVVDQDDLDPGFDRGVERRLDLRARSA